MNFPAPLQTFISRCHMRFAFFKQDANYYLPLARRKGWRWTRRHARLCRTVYLPWLKRKFSGPHGFDREFYIASYVKGPLLFDPLEHYCRRGMFLSLQGNADLQPIRYRLANMCPGDRWTPLLHYIVAREKGHVIRPYPEAACRPGIAERADRVNNFFIACARSGLHIPRIRKILDFGCGDGHMVMAMRAYGLEAFGYDLVARIAPQFEACKEFFRDGETAIDARGAHSGTPNFQLTPGRWQLPFPDQSFDMVFSQQVLEHVFDLDLAFAEMARVLRPGGVMLHLYPPKSCFMERHVHVPLGHRLHFRAYYYLWFLLTRSRAIQGSSARERAASAYNFVDTATCYTANGAMRKLAAKHFAEVHLASYPLRSAQEDFSTMLYRSVFPHTMLLACRK